LIWKSWRKIYGINDNTLASYAGPVGSWVQATVGSEFQLPIPTPNYEVTPVVIPETSPTPSDLGDNLSNLIERKEAAIELLGIKEVFS